MLPLTELRASIPVGILAYQMTPLAAFWWSVLGDIVPVIFIYFLLRGLVGWLRAHFSFFDRLFSWWFRRIERKFAPAYRHWGIWALFIFVALPLPGTGAWAGITAAYLLSLNFQKSFLAIAAGAATAGLLVTLATLGVFNLFGLFT